MFNQIPIVLGQTANDVATSATELGKQSANALVTSFTAAFDQVVQLGPKLAAAAIVLAVGYFLAHVIGKLIVTVSERVGLQRAAERGGVVESMQHAGIQRTVPQIMGTIVFWLLMFLFLMAACNIIGLPAVTDAMSKVVAYIPRLLVATVVVVVGLLLANFLRGLIATSADHVGLSYAHQLATASYYLLVLMVLIAAFEQLEITFELLNWAILIAFAAAALGLGLAFGLGGREVISGILAGYYVRQRIQAGDQVVVGNLQGRVRDVGPVATVIETEKDGLLHRHSIPNAIMLNEAVR
jgi:small-conductance mechanosensitive channel